MVVNFENGFKFPFKDGKWLVKVLIGGALLFVPIVGWLVVLGYITRILSDAKNKKEAILPEWNDWGMLLQEGFMSFVVILCYVLVPSIFISALGRIPIVGCLTFPLQLVVSVLLWPASIIALCFYLDKKEITAAFDFKNLIEKFKTNLADYIIIAFVSSVLGFVSCFTLIFAVFPVFYISVVSFRLYGEVFSAGKAA
jgi:hypothetical protein